MCDWKDCVECPLALWRDKPVKARGSGRVMFIGEAPGAEEEKKGLAFVGRSGELLDYWIGALDLTEKDVYITNVVKCRPPKNRDPSPFEVQECLHWLEDEIRTVKPRLVIPLGRFAREVMGELRQLSLVHDGNYGLALKHPAWYLRRDGIGRVPNDELKFIRKKLDDTVVDEFVEKLGSL